MNVEHELRVIQSQPDHRAETATQAKQLWAHVGTQGDGAVQTWSARDGQGLEEA